MNQPAPDEARVGYLDLRVVTSGQRQILVNLCHPFTQNVN